MHAPLTFEAVALFFFGAVALAIPSTAASRVKRVRAALFSLALLITILLAVRTVAADVRGWFGHAYLVAGYWIPALLVPAGPLPGARATYMDGGNPFEAWLLHTDVRCRRVPITLPGWSSPLLELSYLLCYIIVPVAFLLVWTRGDTGNMDRFWTAVLLSGFVCYGSLPWLISRPPRVMMDSRTGEARVAHGADPSVRAVNEFVLARVSHGLNTFPSGHVAVSLAAALEVLAIWRPAGIVLVVVAAAIAAGAIAGRYHYVIDVALGLVVAIAAWLVV